MQQDLLKPIPMRDLAQICRRVGTCLDIGVDVVKIWEQEMDRVPARLLAPVSRVREGVKEGIPLSEALSGARGAFPRLVVDIVNVGEQSGHTDQAFLQLAAHYDHILSLRRMLLMASIWPMISLGAALFIIGAFILIMGFINSMTGQSLDILGLGLVGFAGFVKYVLFLGFCAGCVALIVWSIRSGRLPVQRLWRWAMAIPMLRIFVQAMSLSRFSWALALGTNSGMSLIKALQLAFASANNEHYEKHADAVVHDTVDGKSIHESLRDTGAFPFEFLAMVEVGETTGRLPETMRKASDQYAAQARTHTTAITVFLGFAVWGCVALIIIAMIFRLFSFYVDTLNNASQI